LCRTVAAMRSWGSSPPARGRDCDARRGGFGWGFIPACAGERLRCTPRRLRLGVHPRLRGGEGRHNHALPADEGSSPPARGRAVCCVQFHVQSGFIPACAGERAVTSGQCQQDWVHPRLRGGEG